MHLLTQILSPALPPTDLIATQPNWTRTDFNRAVFQLSGSLKTHNVQAAALWFDDAALFACAVLAAWHAGARVLLLPNTAQENIAWGETADVFLTDNLVHPQAWHLPTLLAQKQPENARQPENWIIPAAAEAHLKTSGSSGNAQIIVKTATQMQAEALALAATLPFDHAGATAVGSVSPQHLYGFTFRFALSLTLGWAIARAQASYPEHLLAATHGKTVWIASPAVLNRLENGRDWAAAAANIAGIISSGGALPEATAAQLAAHASRPYEIYGSTETGIIASRRGGEVWQPFSGVSFGQDADGALWAQSSWATRVQTADLIEPQAGGFLLLGRKDRIIKLEDKRVSLTQLEHSLLQHAWLADAHCALHHRRVAAWAALNEAGIAALREQGRAAVADALKRHLAATQDKIALPRYWRFADTLPRNAQAKIAAADFQAAFTTPQTAPQWQETAPHVFTGRVPLDLVYFGGHFATFPLVPGVVELQWVRDLAGRFDWGGQNVTRVEALKYQQFVRPHDEIVLTLHHDAAKNKLAFTITSNGNACASGRLVFQAA